MRYTVLKATGVLYSYSALQLYSLLIMQSHWISWASSDSRNELDGSNHHCC
jgi:hypothetical protein